MASSRVAASPRPLNAAASAPRILTPPRALTPLCPSIRGGSDEASFAFSEGRGGVALAEATIKRCIEAGSEPSTELYNELLRALSMLASH